MCEICINAKKSTNYKNLLSKMFDEDIKVIENTKKIAKDMPILNDLNFTSIKWPVKLLYPLFEARAAFAAPNNYFQPLLINGGKTGMFFSGGSTRSVFFSKGRLMVYSKTQNHKDGLNYFTSFVLAHFEPDEYQYGIEKDAFYIRANVEKNFKNLITGKVESKKVSFNFVHKKVKNRIITKEQARNSTHMRIVYDRYSTIQKRLASADMEGYVVSVPHFSPHPYMLQLSKDFGYSDNKGFQENVSNYFKEHLKIKF